MKTRPGRATLQFALSATASAMLAACGGGGGSPGSGADTASNPGSSPAATTTISGKAIDGYLPGVKICFDNGQGACDSTLPSATTDSSGSYTLKVTGDMTGKHLLAIVPAGTTDATSGTTFQTPFVLGALVAGDSQNITPLTSMVAAQVAKGLSQDKASAAVQQLTGVDPNTDYIAGGNSNASTLASQVVSLLTTYAGSSASASQNVLNAVVDTGGTAGVTQAAISSEAAAAAPHTAATTALASPLYAVDGYLGGANIAGSSTFSNYLLRDGFSLVGSTLNHSQDDASYAKAATSIVAGDWTALSPAGGLDSYRLDVVNGGFELKANGTWTPAPVTPDMAYGSATLSSAGDTLAGTDPVTGIGYTVSYGKVDADGQPLASALPVPRLPLMPDGTDIGSHYGSAIQPYMQGSFASGTAEYLATTTWAQDRIILPAGSSAYIMPLTLPTSAASINDVIGKALPVSVSGTTASTALTLNADGSASIAGAVSVTGSWKPYAGNASALVVTLPVTAFDELDGTGDMQTQLRLGRSLVIAYVNGALHQGLLIPASRPDVTALFDANGMGQIKASFDKAITAALSVNAAGIY